MVLFESTKLIPLEVDQQKRGLCVFALSVHLKDDSSFIHTVVPQELRSLLLWKIGGFHLEHLAAPLFLMLSCVAKEPIVKPPLTDLLCFFFYYSAHDVLTGCFCPWSFNVWVTVPSSKKSFLPPVCRDWRKMTAHFKARAVCITMCKAVWIWISKI